MLNEKVKLPRQLVKQYFAILIALPFQVCFVAFDNRCTRSTRSLEMNHAVAIFDIERSFSYMFG